MRRGATGVCTSQIMVAIVGILNSGGASGSWNSILNAIL